MSVSTITSTRITNELPSKAELALLAPNLVIAAAERPEKNIEPEGT